MQPADKVQIRVGESKGFTYSVFVDWMMYVINMNINESASRIKCSLNFHRVVVEVLLKLMLLLLLMLLSQPSSDLNKYLTHTYHHFYLNKVLERSNAINTSAATANPHT